MFIRIDFEGEQRLFRNPLKTFLCHDLASIKQTITEITVLVKQGYYAVGYLAYEAAPAFNHHFVTKDCSTNKLPLLLFGIYQDYISVDSTIPNDYLSPTFSLNCDTSLTEYQQNIAKIKQHIANGESYQTNYTVQFSSKFTSNPYHYYQFLQSHNQANYCAYIEFGELSILSISPELFFKTQDDMIITKPMKGTAIRGIDNHHDERSLTELFSEKNQAENMMIVDLLRNDLSQIAESGTVTVSELFNAEKYPTVWQLTSTITAKLKADVSLFEILTALFPCGSITGAPKASTMKIIAELEKQPREVYCGTIGFLAPQFQQMIFNIPIRTLTINQQHANYGVGGGITWDSTTNGEYQEVLNKTAILNNSITKPDYLIESLLYRDGQYFLEDQHLNRLLQSAHYFDFQCDINKLKHSLMSITNLDPTCSYKIRLCLMADGQFTLESKSINEALEINCIRLAEQCVNSRNLFVYHKTSNRDHLPVIEAKHEMILFNEHQQLTEFVNGNLVMLINNQWVTPSHESGLLAGVMRNYYLQHQQISEATLMIEDLLKAEKIAFINSVRKWISINPVVLENLKKSIRLN